MRMVVTPDSFDRFGVRFGLLDTEDVGLLTVEEIDEPFFENRAYTVHIPRNQFHLEDAEEVAEGGSAGGKVAGSSRLPFCWSKSLRDLKT